MVDKINSHIIPMDLPPESNHECSEREFVFGQPDSCVPSNASSLCQLTQDAEIA